MLQIKYLMFSQYGFSYTDRLEIIFYINDINKCVMFVMVQFSRSNLFTTFNVRLGITSNR